jgi:hypothetical protein
MTIFIVIEDERYDAGSYVHPRAYLTREAAAKRCRRLELLRDDGYAIFRVKELELAGGRTTPPPHPSA